VQHDDDIRAVAQCLDVAGLLVGAVARVVGMRYDNEVERRRERRGAVVAPVIDQDDRVDDARWDSRQGCLERLGRVVRGHHDYGSQRLDRTPAGPARPFLLRSIWQLHPSHGASTNAVLARLTSFGS